MNVFIPSARKAALACFRDRTGKAERAFDEIMNRQDRAAASVFGAVLAGGACEIVSKTGKNLQIVSRSIRSDNCVTVSFFALLGGNWEAVRHADCFSAKKLLENLPQGVNIEIVEG